MERKCRTQRGLIPLQRYRIASRCSGPFGWEPLLRSTQMRFTITVAGGSIQPCRIVREFVTIEAVSPNKRFNPTCAAAGIFP